MDERSVSQWGLRSLFVTFNCIVSHYQSLASSFISQGSGRGELMSKHSWGAKPHFDESRVCLSALEFPTPRFWFTCRSQASPDWLQRRDMRPRFRAWNFENIRRVLPPAQGHLQKAALVLSSQTERLTHSLRTWENPAPTKEQLPHLCDSLKVTSTPRLTAHCISLLNIDLSLSRGCSLCQHEPLGGCIRLYACVYVRRSLMCLHLHASESIPVCSCDFFKRVSEDNRPPAHRTKRPGQGF